MKTIGIIGGLGPETTATFYLELLSLCEKMGAAQRPSIIIASVPMEFEEERRQLRTGICSEKTRKLLIETAQTLQKAGADFVVMPCNSLHVFADDIAHSIRIPFLNLIEVTADFLAGKKVRKVGVLSTLITSTHALYEKRLGTRGIVVHTPAKDEQMVLNEMILRILANEADCVDKKELRKIANRLKEKSGTVILACTDLQLLLPGNHAEMIFDTMKILAEASVEIMLP